MVMRLLIQVSFGLAFSVSALTFGAGTVFAQSICAPTLTACDLQSDMACLERHYACGEYDTIISTLFAETFDRTPDQKFYLGAAFYGRQVRERSAGAQCEMVRFARDNLTDYLGTLDAQFNETGSFGSVRQMDQIYHANQMLTDLGDVSRLAGVVIECLDWAEFITRYDREGALFYLDPPYWGCENDYGKAMFDREDFTRMAAVLSGVQGRFIVSLNDVPEIRGTFANFVLTEVKTSYTIGASSDRAATRAELLISNFKP